MGLSVEAEDEAAARGDGVGPGIVGREGIGGDLHEGVGAFADKGAGGEFGEVREVEVDRERIAGAVDAGDIPTAGAAAFGEDGDMAGVTDKAAGFIPARGGIAKYLECRGGQ